ncbi:MAG: RagB/SusD family nutrient uptake outer membrane protein [Sphingobacteriales bacterium]
MNRIGRHFYKSKRISLMLAVILVTALSSCKKLVETPPPVTALTSDNVYTSDASAASVLTGVYTSLSYFSSSSGIATIKSISLEAGVSADELTVYGGVANGNTALVQAYLNKLLAGSSANSDGNNWNDYYAKLYIVNIALERLAISGSLTPAVKQQLTGEAKFLRAFFYFYLVNLYGDVPLITSSDYRINAVLPRSPKLKVYQQILADLKDAQSLLPDGYAAADAKSVTPERLRPNKWAATALLSRTYLYTGDWVDAEAQATAVINNTSAYHLTPLNTVFLRNSSETIWALQPVNDGWNTGDGLIFVLPAAGPNNSGGISGHPVFLSSQLSGSFEPGDLRKTNWINSVTVGTTTYNYAYKYKSATLNAPVTEYLMVLRLGEQYLIRAEARAHQNNASGAQADLNIIRARAGLGNTPANDQTSLLAAILHERQVELFTEWGHRWLDLKRTGNIDQVMSIVAPAKGATWNSNWQWYPIPAYDLVHDPNLKQNPGY